MSFTSFDLPKLESAQSIAHFVIFALFQYSAEVSLSNQMHSRFISD